MDDSVWRSLVLRLRDAMGRNDLLDSTEASELLGISLDALYGRLYRAGKRGETHPFEKLPRSNTYLASRRDVIAWGRTFVGTRSIRRPPTTKETS